jgi:hypothetical protein
MRFFLGLLAVFVAVAACRAEDDLATLLSQDFRQGKFDERKLKYANRNHWTDIVPERGGLRISFAANRPDTPLRGLEWQKSIQGDFEVTMGYQLLSAEKPPSGKASELFIWLFFWDEATGLKETITLSRSVRPGAGDQFSIYHGKGKDDDFKTTMKHFPAQARAGKLRLKRTAATVSCLVAEAGVQDFTLLDEEPSTTDDLRVVQVAAANGGTLQRYEARILDLEIKGRQAVPTPRTSTPWIWIAALLLGGVGVAAGLWWRRKRNESA